MRGTPTLVSRRADAWLLGGAAAAFWLVCMLSRPTFGYQPPALTGVLSGAIIGIVACHFGVAYHLAYAEDGGGAKSHPLALIALPSLLVVISVGSWIYPHSEVTVGVLRLFITAVFATTIWHYVKQAYGISRLAASLSGVHLSRSDVSLLRYGLYPVWLLSVVRLVTRHQTGSMFGYKVGIGLVGPWLEHGAQAVMVLAGALFLAGPVRRLPAAVWCPGAAAFLWAGWPPSYTSTALVLAATHAIQYLACVYRAERTWGQVRDQVQPGLWLLSVFGAATVAGLFATTWMAPLVSAAAGVPVLPLTATLFVALNLHHYAIDAVIWRSKGDHVRRIVSVRSAPVPGPVPEFSLAR